MEKLKIAIYEGFGTEPIDFNLEWINKQGSSPIKHIQLYINNKPILRMGCMYHKNLLEKTLKEFGLEFDFGPFPALKFQEGPLMKGDHYKMIGSWKS